jgi:hypothetical protein
MDTYKIYVRKDGEWRDPIEVIGAQAACAWIRQHYGGDFDIIELLK